MSEIVVIPRELLNDVERLVDLVNRQTPSGLMTQEMMILNGNVLRQLNDHKKAQEKKQ